MSAEPLQDNIPDLSVAIDKLLANPELISMVASALGSSSQKETDTALSASSATVTPQRADSEEAQKAELLPPLSQPSDPSMLTSLSSLTSVLSKKGQQDDRACLLNALKPYLNPRRRNAIDKIIRFSSLSEILKKL